MTFPSPLTLSLTFKIAVVNTTAAAHAAARRENAEIKGSAQVIYNLILLNTLSPLHPYFPGRPIVEFFRIHFQLLNSVSFSWLASSLQLHLPSLLSF